MAEPFVMRTLNPLITYDMVHSLPYEKLSGTTTQDDLEEEAEQEDDEEVDGDKKAEFEAFNQQGTLATEGKEAALTAEKEIPTYSWNKPCLMIVFQDGDFNSALHYLLDSLHNPFEGNAVASVLVQESLIKQFVDLLRSQLRQLDPQVATHPNYLRSVQKLRALKAQIVVNDEVKASPVLAFDIPQSFLGNGPTGVITIQPFRTPIESTYIYMEPSVPFASVSIWNERVADSYDVIARLKIDTVMINCCNVDLQPIKESFGNKRSDVHLSKGYHYETLVLNGKRKIIVFPMGSIFVYGVPSIQLFQTA
ncbi:uncharacterized protein [Drosophila tropicalis]|uniref:uncharacterized protein n=1 Tax=Drosophila tropicalis TaxID=46794 RepID=UPI0035AB77C0